MLFTYSDVEALATDHIFRLGSQWFREGRATAPSVQRGGEIVSGVLRDAGGRALRVYVRATGRSSSVNLWGECNCRRKTNCEHVIALLLQALQDHGSLPEAAAPGHTVRIKASPDSRVAFASEDPREESTERRARQVLLYLLHLDEQGLHLESVVARQAGNGDYTPGRAYRPGYARGGTPPGFLQSADLELLPRLQELPADLFGGVLISGPGHDALLQALIDTGRCRLGESESRLRSVRPGARRPLRPTWVADDAGGQHLEPRLDPAGQLLRLTELWYIDSHTGEIGPVDCALPAQVLDELLAMPAVMPEQAGDVARDLAGRHPGIDLPLPRVFEIKDPPLVAPVPRLTFITAQTGAGSRGDGAVDYARLRFDYDGVSLDAGGPDTRLRDGCVLRIQRDSDTETAAAQLLSDAGLARDDRASDETGQARYMPRVDGLLADDAGAWLDFQYRHLRDLRERGWQADFDNFRYRLDEVTEWTCDIREGADGVNKSTDVSVALQAQVEGQSVPLLPTLLEVLRDLPEGALESGDLPLKTVQFPYVDDAGVDRLLRLPADQLLPILRTLMDIFGAEPPETGDRLALNRMELLRLSSLGAGIDIGLGEPVRWRSDGDTAQMLQQLRTLDGIPAVVPPAGFNGTLRPYQQTGLNWLQFLRQYGFGGILADDMGLGKTSQSLAHLLLEKESGRASRPSLVVAPTSLMFNWREEARRFAPELSVLVLQGPNRKDNFHRIDRYDLVLTTYPLLARDHEVLLGRSFHLLILDEAQTIKNPRAQASRLVREIDARHRLCLTGTPVENHLDELWSMFDFLMPGLLGSRKAFARNVRTPVEKHGSESAVQRLRASIGPFLMRRTKQQVATELPEKTEILQHATLSERQRELYDTLRLAMHRRVREEITRQGLARSRIVILDALLKLRQACCDPRLIKGLPEGPVPGSAKLDLLMQLVPGMVEDGRRILIFSQFTSMLDLIEQAVREAQLPYVKLTGRTRDRRRPVERFQSGDVPLFLISLKAGGTGLNLTAADTVIHYDPWWNPAVERQATDRAHRIGQRQPVFVYKLLCSDTVEETIHHMQQRKQALADSLYEGDGQHEPQWSADDVDQLFSDAGSHGEAP